MISAVQTPGEGAGTLPSPTHGKITTKSTYPAEDDAFHGNPNLSAGPLRPLEGEQLTAPTICRKATSNERSMIIIAN